MCVSECEGVGEALEEERGRPTWMHVLQIRQAAPHIGSSGGGKSAGVSAWLQTAACTLGDD